MRSRLEAISRPKQSRYGMVARKHASLLLPRGASKSVAAHLCMHHALSAPFPPTAGYPANGDPPLDCLNHSTIPDNLQVLVPLMQAAPYVGTSHVRTYLQNRVRTYCTLHTICLESNPRDERDTAGIRESIH